jgi:hypothetical protein
METVNTTENHLLNSNNKPKKRRRILRFFGISLGLLSLIMVAWHFVWKYSGSGEWEFVHEKEGTKVFSLKTPGVTLQKYKMIGQFDAKLGPIMKVMRDPDACDDVGCFDSRILNNKDFPRYVYYTFKYPTPKPFKPREFVVLSEFHQDPDTKEIYVDFQAAEGLLPPDDCCVRVTKMHNKWMFRPLSNGKVEVEFIIDADLGGSLPYFLLNARMRANIHTNVTEIQEVLDRDEYQNIKIDYVLEVDEDLEQMSEKDEDIEVTVSP